VRHKHNIRNTNTRFNKINMKAAAALFRAHVDLRVTTTSLNLDTRYLLWGLNSNTRIIKKEQNKSQIHKERMNKSRMNERMENWDYKLQMDFKSRGYFGVQILCQRAAARKGEKAVSDSSTLLGLRKAFLTQVLIIQCVG
jgi:hypothetical protein